MAFSSLSVSVLSVFVQWALCHGLQLSNVVKSQHFEIIFYKFCFDYLHVSPGKRVEPEEAKKAAAAAALEEHASLCISEHCECTCCGTGASIRPG